MSSKPRPKAWNLGLSTEPLSAVPPDTRIWRYMDLAKFISMLQNGALYFSVLAMLGDDMEAALPRVPENASAVDRMRAYTDWNFIRSTMFASCWHVAQHESAALWSIYGGRHQGIAIQSSMRSLTNGFPLATQEDIRQIVKVGRVEYIDPDLRELPARFGNSYSQALAKRKWYSYENELRLLCSPFENWREPALFGDPGQFAESGAWVACNLRLIFESVVIAPMAVPYLESVVREVLAKFEFDPVIVKSSELNETVKRPDLERYREEMRRFAEIAKPPQ